MKRLINFLIIFILLIPCFLMPTYVEAKTLGDLKQELKKLEQEKEEQDKDKQLTQEQIDQLHQELYQISINKDEIYKENLRLEEEINNLTKEIEQKDKEIKEIINFVQISNGESAYLEYAFGAQDFTDFIYRMAVSEQLTKHNESLIESYNQLIEENEQKKVELKAKEQELIKAQTKANEKITELGEHLNAVKDIKISVDSQIAAAKKSIKMYEEELGCKDNEDLSNCGYQKLPADTAFYRPTERATISSIWGERIYQLNGKTVRDFHYGYDLTYWGNVPIYASANGRVAMLNVKEGCGGNIVYIHHVVKGKRYTTIYAHLKSSNVKVGQVVTPQTVIGYMGGNPSETWWDKCSSGQHLHFEVTNGLILVDYPAHLFNAYAVDPKTVVNFPGYQGYYKDRLTRY